MKMQLAIGDGVMSGASSVPGLDSPRAYQFTLAALDTLAKLYDDPLSRFRSAACRSAHYTFYPKLFRKQN